jgi:lipopolysaccharide/colanic/teichoic acid biosynthesis glycosyltransferase
MPEIAEAPPELETIEKSNVAVSAYSINEATKVILPYEYAEDEHYYVESLGEIKKKPFYSFVKRAFDIVACSLALIILALPMLIIAIAVKCSSQGPVFYKQERLGLNGKKFMLVKFRSMVNDAEKNGAKWSDGDNDSRITKVGSILRKTRMDELPQLWTCVTGQLSLIGPRPEREVFYDAFEEHVHGFRERLKVKPGITGLAQVSGGYDLRPEEKVLYDIEYIKNRSIWLEIKILFKTVAVVLGHKGAK